MFDGSCVLWIIHTSSKSVNLVVMSQEPRWRCLCGCAHLFTIHLACIIDIHVYIQLSKYIQIRESISRIANSPSRIGVGTRKDGLWHRALGLLRILASKTLAPVVTTFNAVPCWHQGHRLAPMRIFNTNGGKEGCIVDVEVSSRVLWDSISVRFFLGFAWNLRLLTSSTMDNTSSRTNFESLDSVPSRGCVASPYALQPALKS